MRGELAGRVAIVTAGGWNIGRAVAERFAAAGARVVVASRRADRLEETVAAIRAQGGEASACVADVTDLAQCEALAAETLARHGTIDIVAALAGGMGGYGRIDEVDPAAWRATVEANLFGAFHTVRATLPVLRAKNAGEVLLCTGGGGFFPMLGETITAYACAKAAICRLTDQLTAEHYETGIRFHCLEPGMVWSPETLAGIEAEERRTGVPHPGRAHNHPPEDAAELALFLVSERSRPLRGRCVSVDDPWWRDPAQVQRVEQTLSLYRLHRVRE